MDICLNDSIISMGRWIGARLGANPANASMNVEAHAVAYTNVCTDSVANQPCELEVLSAWGKMQKNRRYGRQFRIKGKMYERGLHCHAPASIKVMPEACGAAAGAGAVAGSGTGPGAAAGTGKPEKSILKALKAVIGMDDTLQWDVRDYQSGPIWPEAVLLLESLDGKEFFRSEVLNSSKAVEIDVPLDGIDGFMLKVIGTRKIGGQTGFLPGTAESAAAGGTFTVVHDWCELDIADAKLVYEDGKERYLDELSMAMGISGYDDELPFEFTYGGKSFRDSAKDWNVERGGFKSEPGRESYDIRYTDGKTGLEVKCSVVRYLKYPAVEWTLNFKNNGSKNTPVISGIRVLDTGLVRREGSEYILHYNIGGACRFDDFRPVEEKLLPGVDKQFRCVVGYSSDPYMPYFNVEDGSGEGMIAAIGWPGQWAAGFTRQGDNGLRITAGQETTHFYLEPGEEVRSPLIVLMMWRGDYTDSQNLWRRWMMEYGMPHTEGGKPIEPIMYCTNTGSYNFAGVTGENQLEGIKWYIDNNVEFNLWEIDLGWHPYEPGNEKLAFEAGWVPDPVRFPDGLKPLTEYAKKHNKTVSAWFAPESMNFGGHAEWLISGVLHEPLARGIEYKVFDFGNREAMDYLIDHIDGTIKKEGLGMFRIDNGWGMLPIWEAQDEPDRKGIKEIRYIEGYLRLFDELLYRNPGLVIDNCCRGGRRLDIETHRRSILFTPTDYTWDIVASQCHMYGMSQWILHAGAGVTEDPYHFRSNIRAIDGIDLGKAGDSKDFEPIRRLIGQREAVKYDLFGDYYPLTPYSCEDWGWFALQYNSPEKGKGFAVVIRRSQYSPGVMESDTMAFKLKGLDRNATYVVRDMDSGEEKEYAGEELYIAGLRVTAPLHTALLFSYKIKQMPGITEER